MLSRRRRCRPRTSSVLRGVRGPGGARASSSASCGPRPRAPPGWPRPTSCAPRCSPRCRTTCARRCVDQGVGHEPAAARRRLDARRDATSSSRPSTRRPTGSTTLVGNLLDMSRLQTGALQLVLRDVGLEEVVPAAVAGLPATGRVVLDVARDAPARPRRRRAARAGDRQRRRERARLVARRRARCGVEAGAVGDRVDLRVVDRGPGIPVEQRDAGVPAVPAARDDRSNGTGVGLGLAVARGFVEAMGGDDHGRGHARRRLTMVISLRRRGGVDA